MGFAVIFIALIVVVCGCSVVIGDNAHLLNADLFGNYERKIRPRSTHTDQVVVEIEFVLNSISNLYWTDDFLTWTPSNYSGIEHIVYPASNLWLPDFGIINSAESFFDEDYAKNFHVFLHFSGNIVWAFGGIFSTTCSLDLSFYPFDTQSCQIIIQNWAYTEKDVMLIPKKSQVVVTDYSTNGLWTYMGSEVTDTNTYRMFYQNESYPRIIYTLNMQRKTSYYFLSIIAPCFLLVNLTLVVFWLPPDAGEKIGLGITVVLAFSVYQIIIGDATPATSDSSPIIAKFILFIMCVATFSTLLSIFVLYFNHKTSQVRMNDGVRSFFFKYCAKILCMKNVVPNCVAKVGDSRADDITGQDVPEKLSSGGGGGDDGTLGKISKDVAQICKNLDEKAEGDTVQDEWKALALVLDRIFFWIILFICVIGSVTILVMRH